VYFNNDAGGYALKNAATLRQLLAEEQVMWSVRQLNLVFGLADLSERRAVIALPRLRGSDYGARDDEALCQKEVQLMES
jgi:predicted Zn-dependent protease